MRACQGYKWLCSRGGFTVEAFWSAPLPVFSEARPVWKMVAGLLKSLSGLDLATVSQDERQEIEGNLCAVNGIFSLYPLESPEDYKTMAYSHQFEVLTVVAPLCESILEKSQGDRLDRRCGG